MSTAGERLSHKEWRASDRASEGGHHHGTSLTTSAPLRRVWTLDPAKSPPRGAPVRSRLVFLQHMPYLKFGLRSPRRNIDSQTCPAGVRHAGITEHGSTSVHCIVPSGVSVPAQSSVCRRRAHRFEHPVSCLLPGVSACSAQFAVSTDAFRCRFD